MFRQNIKLNFIVVCFLLTSCDIAIQSNSSPTTQPILVTATLRPTVTPQALETLLPPSSLATAEPLNGTTSTRLNVRTEPSTASQVIGTIEENTSVKIIGKDIGGNWWQILYEVGNNENGWVTAQYVETGDSSQVPVIGGAETESQVGNTAVIIQQLNIRSGPGTDFNSLGILNENDVVTLTGRNRSGSWLQVEFTSSPDGKGWINSGFVKTETTEDLPIISETGDILGTGTPADTPLPSTPTLAPAPMDFDSADSPVISATFTSTGLNSLLYTGEVSAPNGDKEDWISITPYTTRLLINLSCIGRTSLQVNFSETDRKTTCDAGQQIIDVTAGTSFLIHIKATELSTDLTYTSYTLQVISLP